MRLFSTNPTATAPANNSFGVVQPDHGTSPSAGTPDATVTFTSSDASVTITGNSSTNTVNFQSTGGGGGASGAITSLGGDGGASGPGFATFILSTVNSNVGTFGSATLIPLFTVNGKGLITFAGTTAIIDGAITSLTGDVTATGPGAATSTLATVNSSVGTYGSATLSPIFTVNGKGLVTFAGTTAVIGTTAITSLIGDATAAGPGQATITFATVNSTSGTYGSATLIPIFTVNAKGLMTASGTTTISSITAMTGLSGDGTAAGPGVAALTLATVNTTTGTYGSATLSPIFTVNDKGLVTFSGSTAIVVSAASAAANSLTGVTLANNVVQSSLTSLGTITTGTWNGINTSGATLLTTGTTFTTTSSISTNTMFKVTLVGGGGAGAGSAATTDSGPGAGGSGGYGVVWLTGLSPSTSYLYGIGSGGAGSTNIAGGIGGDTFFVFGGVTYAAFHGSGGASLIGGAGGGVTSCVVTLFGQPGGSGQNIAQKLDSAAGGSNPLGFGGPSVNTPATGANNGNSGTGYGSGGGSSNTGAASQVAGVGGNGAAGAILIEWQS